MMPAAPSAAVVSVPVQRVDFGPSRAFAPFRCLCREGVLPADRKIVHTRQTIPARSIRLMKPARSSQVQPIEQPCHRAAVPSATALGSDSAASAHRRSSRQAGGAARSGSAATSLRTDPLRACSPSPARHCQAGRRALWQPRALAWFGSRCRAVPFSASRARQPGTPLAFLRANPEHTRGHNQRAFGSCGSDQRFRFGPLADRSRTSARARSTFAAPHFAALFGVLVARQSL